jgi:DNA-binding MarR family transcriptional regulator
MPSDKSVGAVDKTDAIDSADGNCPNASEGSGRQARKVTLKNRDLRDAIRLLNLLLGDDEDRAFDLEPNPGAAGAFSRADLTKAATDALIGRRRRNQLFGSAMFRDSAWDMLLVLYIEQGGRRFSIGQLANAARTPATSALRWLDYLENRKLVRRRSHPTDARAVFVELTSDAIETFDLYFSETLTRAQ